ncbi:M10 family metallopeptidase C-terminal domain-containing protein [Tabrizicola oligotrophica]|uniref:Calcium-binding protein n=1 Tax=Tabrizicola oligotrophica TaxID=2710650 RepID=A0A6M0QZV0_9RHOB|nr:hypothetical protein [Tabrizicola oligotrophica]NEY92112.1 hypothetical protein [Tabrizicola oligotrophica]
MTILQGAELGFGFIADGLAVVQAGGYLRLIYAARDDNRLAAVTLADGLPSPMPDPAAPVIGSAPGADIAVQDNAGSDRVYVFASHDGLLRHATLGATGAPGLTNGTLTDQGYLFGVTAMEILERGPTDMAVIAQRTVAGLQVFSISETGAVSLIATLADGPKSYLADVADLASVEVAGRSFLLAASALENGISLFEIDSAGAASFVDAIGAADGLPLGGPAALQTVRFGGEQFVLVAATLSASVSVLRINEMGVIFVEDHLIDDRATRFDDVAALDAFPHAGRVFVVAAGSDAGVSVLELLPGGRLSHVTSLALETGAGIGTVTGIEAAVLNGRAAIFLTDAGGTRIHQLEIALAGIGGLVGAQGGLALGGNLDERLLGTAAAETLQGGGGDDFLHDGAGNDLLLGGAGADVFVLDRDGSADRIGDFQDGIDRIDVSDWGRIYAASALTINITASGAVVSYGDESLTITRAGSAALQLTEADFLF